MECADRRGLVHAITGVLLKHGVNVVGNQEFVDRGSARFFMRTEFDGAVRLRQLEAEVRQALPPDARVRLSNLKPKRIVVLASKEHHCLGDILIRHAFGELNAQVLAVFSNHAALQPLVNQVRSAISLPQPRIAHARGARSGNASRPLSACKPDYLVLAKYMRVLTPEFRAPFSRAHREHPSLLSAGVHRRAGPISRRLIAASR